MRSLFTYAAPFVILSACTCNEPTVEPSPAPEPVPVDFTDDPDFQGMRVILSDADKPDDGSDSVTPAKARPISDAQTAKLLARLPQLEEKDGDRQVFALRKGSQPAPRTGDTVDVPFPPKPEIPPPDPTEQGDLTVVRFAPEGSVTLAPKLSVSFSQPMVAVTSQDEAAKTIPVHIEPEPHGQWRWIGTKTVLFEPDPRFPMSTDYQVTVDAGTKSVTGGVLNEAKAWTFDTPTTQLEQYWPSGGPMGLTPNIFMSFNQRIDSKAVWERLTLQGGGKTQKIVQLTEAEIAEDPTIKRMTESAEPGRWMAFRAVEELDKATWYSVTIETGPLSAEGPKPTPGTLSFGFQTYSPLEVVEHRCGYGSQACPPYANWWITFNNPLDPKAFAAKSLSISPEIKAPLNIYPSGSAIYFDGRKPGSRKYTVTIPAGLTDSFGQTLGKDQDVSFVVGKDEPSLTGTGSPMIVLDPDAPPTMAVYSTNHAKLRLRVYRVAPAQWYELSKWWEDHNNDYYHRSDLPGQRLTDKVIPVGGDVDAMVETAVDLQPYLKDGYGQLLVWVTPTRPSKDAWNRQEVIHWVQRTDLGLTAFHDRERLQVWANALADGATVDGVTVTLHGQQPGDSGEVQESEPVAIGADGLAELDLNANSHRSLLVARRGEDMALLPQSNAFWRSGGWYPYSPSDTMRWFVFDDRGMYKPGETVTVKGWMRKYEHGPHGDIAAISTDSVTWELRGSRGNELLKGETMVSDLGGFDLSFELPDNANLGQASLFIRSTAPVSGTQHVHPVQIQEFRRPEFEVKASIDPGHHILGEHVHASVDAHYYAGGGLPSAETQWYGHTSMASYVPPNRSEYSFGRWTPWWGGYFWQPPAATGPGANHTGKTDASGTHDIDVHIEAMNPPRPMTLNLQASVVDVNRQQWTSMTSMLVHPSALYIGLKAHKQFIQPGGTFEIDAIVSDIDGEIVAGQAMELELSRLEWGTDDNGVWGMQVTDKQPCSLTSKQDAARCSLSPDKAGQYEMLARVVDSEGRPNESTLRLWVAGSKQPPNRGVGQDQVTLVPSGKEFSDGDVAEIFVQAPFAPAEGVLSYRRSGLLHSERFKMQGATTTLKIPIAESHVPNLYVQVDLVGKKQRTTDEGDAAEDVPERPAYASGSINLPVPPRQRTLAVTATPRVDALEPGGSTEIDVTVMDAAGKPVSGGEVVVAVVDESILALSGYQLADPIGIFYAQRGPEVTDYHLRNQVILANPADITKATGAPGADSFDDDDGWEDNKQRKVLLGNDVPMVQSGAMFGAAVTRSVAQPMEAKERSNREIGGLKSDSGEHPQGQTAPDRDMATTAIALRTDFSALALFKPDLATNAEGKVSVSVKLPDSLTRYRIMVVAASGENHFGKGESGITARNPVMVRPSPPRFLNFGDRAELPVVIQNQTDKPVSVDVAMRATNAILISQLPSDPKTVDVSGKAEAGQRITVAGNDRVEVRFPVAADMAGTARFQIAVAAGDFADATEISLPVWTPATTEAFATYGEIDDGSIVQPVAAPPDVWTQFGGLEITTSSTAVQALTDAVIYLSNYPFSCNEQLSSRVLAIAALRDVLTAFDAEGLPDASALEAQVDRDLAQLKGRQNYDGGFGFWKRGDPSWPYLSIHVAHSASRAMEKGFEIDPNMYARMLSYLQNIESYIPSWYGLKYRRTLIAYALYTRERLGDHDGARARRLFREAGLEGPDSLSLEAQGWLLHVLAADKADDIVAQIERNWMNKVSETAAAAHFVTSYGDDAAHVLLHSDRRVDGVLLEALVKVKPENDLIPKVVRGLLAHKKRGRWGNTQENAFVLVAMDAYFNKFEAQTPDFVARAWLGEGYAGDHTFKGRTTERARIDIPMGYLTETKGAQDLVLQKDGVGRMYYRIGMRYAPRDLRLDPADRGFTVQRTYEAVDDPGDVVRKDKIWYVKAGAKVRVRVTMVATGRRYHVALVDPLPAGFEAMNPALKVTGALPQDPTANQGRYWWWNRTWYEHENLRDERVEAFTSLLWDGVHEYTYVARATTPGQFVVPPPKAEEMYHPETFGRGATTRVVIR